MPGQGVRAGVVAALAALLAFALALAPAGDPAEGKRKRKKGPNVVVVMTDDQTLASLDAMPRTRELIGAQGVTFANSFASYPLCCPSRATFLTGRYAHNHKVLNNIPPQGGFDKLRSSETLPVWLGRSGYYTGMVGKYLNGYEQSRVAVPPGYDEFYGQKTQNAYYGFELQENDGRVLYGSPRENPADPNDPAAYSTDVFTEKAVDFISRRAPFGQPFFLWVNYNAPHSGIPDPPPGERDRCRGNAKPAARHIGAFQGAPLPIPPSFNEADVSDKPPSIRDAPGFDSEDVAGIHDFYRCELESLLAVDDGVQRIMDAIGASGDLGRTVVVFTSDNGFFHGEHRQPFGKHLLYEESIRVPLLIRGPGFKPGVTVQELVANVDLAPTILDLAHANARLPQDGRSLLPMVRRPASESGRELVIESNRYEAVRTQRYIYAVHDRGPDVGARELYDLKLDPFQLESLHNDSGYAAVRRALVKRLAKLDGCAGEECRTEPALEIELGVPARRSRRGRQRDCVRGGAAATIRGDDARRVIEAIFRVKRRKLHTDRRHPYRARVPAGRLGRKKPTAIRARATLRDGRRVDLQTRARRCR